MPLSLRISPRPPTSSRCPGNVSQSVCGFRDYFSFGILVSSLYVTPALIHVSLFLFMDVPFVLTVAVPSLVFLEILC